MPAESARLLVATKNTGKLREFRALMAGLPIDVCGLELFEHVDEVAEVGSTFAENAALKASGYARQTDMMTLADDSGLEVMALGGRPGVLSARYGGPDTSFEEKMAKLLAELDEVRDKDRSARFVASIAIADKAGRIIQTATGICPGRIAAGPRGSGGFGYDPLFIPDAYQQTFGELPEEIKREISHRGRSFSQIIPFLRGFFAI